jgi:23S rRNA pseudouridine1911/1915/1917 synthase
VPVAILFQDERLLAVDKPAGLLSVPDAGSGASSVPEELARQGIAARAVHRLDRDVSGVLLLARSSEAYAGLEELFRRSALRKVYWALAVGRLAPPEGKLTFPILEEPGGARVSARGKPARTLYRTLAAFDATSELELELVTGRKNQIRVHLAHAGHPLVGERKYARGRESSLDLRPKRVALHAWRLAFDHPWSGERLELEAPLPGELVELRERASRSEEKPRSKEKPRRARRRGERGT